MYVPARARVCDIRRVRTRTYMCVCVYTVAKLAGTRGRKRVMSSVVSESRGATYGVVHDVRVVRPARRARVKRFPKRPPSDRSRPSLPIPAVERWSRFSFNVFFLITFRTIKARYANLASDEEEKRTDNSRPIPHFGGKRAFY